MRRGRPSRETGHREIEAAPKEMDGARLAEKAGTEELEDPIDLDERAPEAVGRAGIIACVASVLRKPDWVRHLIRHFMNADRNAEVAQKIHCSVIELGDWLRSERKSLFLALAGPPDQLVVEEIKLELKSFFADRDRRCAEPAGGNVKRDLPAMVQPGGQRQPDLADDLRPELQCLRGIAPARIRQIGQNGDPVVHGVPPVQAEASAAP